MAEETFAECMSRKLKGTRPGHRGGVREAFTKASKECRQELGTAKPAEPVPPTDVATYYQKAREVTGQLRSEVAKVLPDKGEALIGELMILDDAVARTISDAERCDYRQMTRGIGEVQQAVHSFQEGVVEQLTRGHVEGTAYAGALIAKSVNLFREELPDAIARVLPNSCGCQK